MATKLQIAKMLEENLTGSKRQFIEIVSIDYDTQMVKFQFPNGNDVLEQPIQRIVQLEVIPVKINN